jgi:heptosyltransferase-2
VRIPNWLGDALLARPLFHALRRAAPDAERMAVGPAPLLDLLAADAVFDRRAPWPAERTEREALIGVLERWRPEIAWVLPPSFSSAWFAFRTGAPVRVGYRGDGRSLLLTRAPRRPPRGERHLSREYLDLAAALGVGEAAVPPLPVPEEARERADRLLGGSTHDRPVVLGPGAIFGPAKRWGEDRFAAVGVALAKRGARIVVCGTGAEREACERVARAIGDGAVSLAGATGLLEQAAICARARVAVCNDSGLAHLSAAVGCPTVAIFGSTSSAWTAPIGERVRIVQHAPVCAPCFQRTCRIGYGCLTAVTVGEVERACEEIAA